MKNKKDLILSIFAMLFFSAANLSAVQIIIDDWATDNQWTGKAPNGSSAQFYTEQTFGDSNEFLVRAGGNSAVDGRPNFYLYKPSSDGFDGWGTLNSSFNAWDRSLDTSLGAPINGNNQLLKMGNSVNQNRFDVQLTNNGSVDVIFDSIGIMARNNFGINHPDTFKVYALQAGASQGAQYKNEFTVNGANYAPIGASVSTVQIGDTITYTGNQAKWIEMDSSDWGGTATIAAGDSAAFRFEFSGNSNGTGTGIAQTHLDTLTMNITPVPEPSTYALLAGFVAFLFVAIRKRK